MKNIQWLKCWKLHCHKNIKSWFFSIFGNIMWLWNYHQNNHQWRELNNFCSTTFPFWCVWLWSFSEKFWDDFFCNLNLYILYHCSLFIVFMTISLSRMKFIDEYSRYEKWPSWCEKQKSLHRHESWSKVPKIQFIFLFNFNLEFYEKFVLLVENDLRTTVSSSWCISISQPRPTHRSQMNSMILWK